MSKRMRRLGLPVVSAVIALAAATSAGGAITPLFSATTTADATVVSYAQGAGDDPLAALTFYVPVDYAALLAQPEGEVIGTVTGEAIAADLAGNRLQLSGSITVGLATTAITSAGASVTLGQAATVCTGTATHSAFWVLNLSAAGQTLQVPAFVDDVPLTIPLSSIANTTITFCLPPPDLPAGTPGRAALGAKFVSARLNITDVFSAAPQWYLWHAIATPYTPGTGKANVSGRVEAQSVDRTPQTISLKAKLKQTNSVVVSGRVIAGGKGVVGAPVTILAGKKAIGKATTKSGGSFSAVVAATRLAKLSATTAVAPRKSASCTAYFAPAPCAGSWVAGFTATSATVRARP